MDDRITSQAYETPRVVDYGDLQELTAACQNIRTGDGSFAGNSNTPLGFSVPGRNCALPPSGQ